MKCKDNYVFVAGFILIALAVIYLLYRDYSIRNIPASLSQGADLVAASKGSIGSSVYPPELISATQTSTSSIELVWTDPNLKETGYIVFRGSGDNYLLQKELYRSGQNAVKYIDTAVVPGMTYSYSIRPYVTKGRQFSLYQSSNLIVITTN